MVKFDDVLWLHPTNITCFPPPAPQPQSLRPTLSGNRLIRPQDQSIYNSQDGFGDPDPDRNLCSNWAACGEFDHESWVKLLTTLHATPGTYLTVIVMELCDRGSLAGAIHKGLFDCGDLGLAPVPGLSPIPPPASGPTANSTNEYSFSHRLTRSTKGGAAGARGGTMGGVQCSPEGPRITLRALLRTAREIALGMHHMHCDKLVHGGELRLAGCAGFMCSWLGPPAAGLFIPGIACRHCSKHALLHCVLLVLPSTEGHEHLLPRCMLCRFHLLRGFNLTSCCTVWCVGSCRPQARQHPAEEQPR